MTAVARQLHMATGKFLQLTGLIAVTIGAQIFQQADSRGLLNCMWILMTGLTIGLFFSMNRYMTGFTLRHDCRVIIPEGIIGMEDCMASPAIKLVLAAALFDIVKMFRMTLAALCQCQRRRVRSIQ